MKKERKCKVCGENQWNLLIKRGNDRRNICKRCHAYREHERRTKAEIANPNLVEERKQQSRDRYERKREQIKTDLDARIRFWAKQNKNRSTHNRKELSIEFVVEEAKKALEVFPYMKFLDRDNLFDTASIDRIDSTKGYTDDNIRIVTYWLNSAKMNMSEEQLKERMQHYLKTI